MYFTTILIMAQATFHLSVLVPPLPLYGMHLSTFVYIYFLIPQYWIKKSWGKKKNSRSLKKHNVSLLPSEL